MSASLPDICTTQEVLLNATYMVKPQLVGPSSTVLLPLMPGHGERELGMGDE